MSSIFSLVLCIHLVGGSAIENGGDRNLDARHQAMYLFNVVRYVDWNEEKIVVGVFGETDVIPELERLSASIESIEVKSLKTLEDIGACHIVFLPNATSVDFFKTQQQIGDASTLLIVDKKQLVLRGAEMGFYLEGGKLKFGVNTQALEETGVKISRTFLDRVSSF